MDKIPTMPSIVLDIFTIIYYFDVIIIDSDPESVTNNANNNENKY